MLVFSNEIKPQFHIANGKKYCRPVITEKLLHIVLYYFIQCRSCVCTQTNQKFISAPEIVKLVRKSVNFNKNAQLRL